MGTALRAATRPAWMAVGLLLDVTRSREELIAVQRAVVEVMNTTRMLSGSARSYASDCAASLSNCTPKRPAPRLWALCRQMAEGTRA